MATRRFHDPTTLGFNLFMKKVKKGIDVAKYVTALCQHSFSHLSIC